MIRRTVYEPDERYLGTYHRIYPARVRTQAEKKNEKHNIQISSFGIQCWWSQTIVQITPHSFSHYFFPTGQLSDSSSSDSRPRHDDQLMLRHRRTPSARTRRSRTKPETKKFPERKFTVKRFDRFSRLLSRRRNVSKLLGHVQLDDGREEVVDDVPDVQVCRQIENDVPLQRFGLQKKLSTRKMRKRKKFRRQFAVAGIFKRQDHGKVFGRDNRRGRRKGRSEFRFLQRRKYAKKLFRGSL